MKLEALRAEIQRGADSGSGIPAAEVFAGVRDRLAQEGAGRSGP
jgi:antitoxin ParD1/3/4